MKQLLALALGILTAIGGFVDIGDLVTNALVGSRFGLSLAWVVAVGVIGIIVFAEMSGRVAAVSGPANFDLVRERLGPRIGLANLLTSMGVTFLTFIAEIGGVPLSVEIAAGVKYLLWGAGGGAGVGVGLLGGRLSPLRESLSGGGGWVGGCC